MTRIPDDIRTAIDTTLSGASHDPTLFNRVVNASKGDTPPVKKKLTLSMAFALVLMMLTATAFAAAAYHGVSYFLTDHTCEPIELDPELLMTALRQSHTSKRLNAAVNDAYWDGKTLSIAFHLTAHDPSTLIVIPCETATHEHYRPTEDADILLELPNFINITVGNEIIRPMSSSLNWLYEEDGTVTIMTSFPVNDMTQPIVISLPITNALTTDGSEEFAMLHCDLPAMVDPIAEHVHDWIPATCVSPVTCRICGRFEGDLGEHDFQPGPEEGQYTCPVCTYSYTIHK